MFFKDNKTEEQEIYILLIASISLQPLGEPPILRRTELSVVLF